MIFWGRRWRRYPPYYDRRSYYGRPYYGRPRYDDPYYGPYDEVYYEPPRLEERVASILRERGGIEELVSKIEALIKHLEMMLKEPGAKPTPEEKSEESRSTI